MEENDKVDLDYLKGFNEGYIFAKHLPELSDQLSKTELKSIRGLGFQDGRKEFIAEQIKDKFPSWLKGGRLTKDNPNPNKSKDRDVDGRE